MANLYDARGNTYFVATPDEIRAFVDLPATADEAAQTRERWAIPVIERICARRDKGTSRVKKYLSDGLLLGPFLEQDEHTFSLLIVNTDATLAERSGNGLTIFSQFLVETGRATRSDPFFLRVHHGRPPSAYTQARVEAAVRDGQTGFWIDLGIPTFGPSQVDASPEYIGVSEFEGRTVTRVFELEKIDPLWASSQFVNVGNPHCVTFLKSPDQLPSMEQLGSDDWLPRLTAIANSTDSPGVRGAGRPCKNGINLQWAALTGSGRADSIDARVFERGEGPTLSSGSSATAVASAARKLGLVKAETVNVRMPGGVAPVRFVEHNGTLERVMLFGQAVRANSKSQES